MLRILLIIAFIFIVLPVSSANMKTVQDDQILKIFDSGDDRDGTYAVLKGKVLNLGVKEISLTDIRQTVQDKTKITVRLNSNDGITKGSILYIVDEKNLIVSKLEVLTIVKSASFGYILVGYGNFRRVKEDDKVVQKRSDFDSKYAYIHKARGDYYLKNGNQSSAIIEYQNAVAKDKTYPDAHIELGYIFLAENNLEYAMKEFDEAYKYRDNIFDNDDKYRMYMGMLETRNLGAYNSTDIVNYKNRMKFISEAVKIGEEAYQYYSSSEMLNIYLGKFHLYSDKPDDVKSKKYLSAAVKINDRNAEAFSILAELYLKHDNPEKAEEFARKSLDIDPANYKSREILLKLNK